MSEQVSVIIPMRDAAPWIGEAITSLRAQSLQGWRAIVVDNGSTDGSIEAAERAASGDQRLMIVPGSPEGPSEARNAGLDRARGQYVLFLDADDWLLPGALESLVRRAATSGHGAAYGAIEWRDAKGAPLEWSCADGGETVGLDQLLEGNAFPIHAAIVARECLGGLRFDASLTVAEDHDLWLRLATRGVEWAPVGETVGGYRLRPGSLTRDPSRWVTAWRSVMTSAFRRARTRGWEARGVDVSPGRQRRTLNRMALELATRAAPHDRSSKAETCAGIYRAGAFPTRFSAIEAASAAYWHLPHALCLPPTAWRSRAAELCPALARWWMRAAIEGWGPADLPERGVESLATHAVDQAEVLRSLVGAVKSSVRTGDQVVVVGLGRNGAAVCPALRTAGIEFRGFDDRFTRPTVNRSAYSVGGVDVPIAPASILSERDGLFVLTPADDGALAARLPAGARVIRWSETARALAADQTRALRAAWPGSPAVAGTVGSARPGEAAA